MQNNYGSNLGRIEMVRVLGDYWAAGLSGLRSATGLALAVARLTGALLLGGLFWLGVLVLKAFSWLFD